MIHNLIDTILNKVNQHRKNFCDYRPKNDKNVLGNVLGRESKKASHFCESPVFLVGGNMGPRTPVTLRLHEFGSETQEIYYITAEIFSI